MRRPGPRAMRATGARGEAARPRDILRSDAAVIREALADGARRLVGGEDTLARRRDGLRVLETIREAPRPRLLSKNVACDIRSRGAARGAFDAGINVGRSDELVLVSAGEGSHGGRLKNDRLIGLLREMSTAMSSGRKLDTDVLLHQRPLRIVPAALLARRDGSRYENPKQLAKIELHARSTEHCLSPKNSQI